MIYDTEEIERVAARIARLSDGVTAAASGNLRHTADEMPVRFKGEAAQELQTSLNGLFKDVHTCANNLNRLSELLYAYARLLRLADKEARSNIESH